MQDFKRIVRIDFCMDFYIFLITHAYRHWISGGIGLRFLTDIYIYRRKTALDEAYITEELQKLDLADFEEQVRSLSFHLFGGEEITPTEENMLDDFMQFRPDKIYEKRILHDVQQAREKSGRMGYLLKRIFPSMEQIKEADPFFYRHKVLLPFMVPYRLIRAVFTRRRKFLAEVKAFFKA